MKPTNPKSQTTIWIVMLAIVVALVAGTFFLLQRPAAPTSNTPTGSPLPAGAKDDDGRPVRQSDSEIQEQKKLRPASDTVLPSGTPKPEADK